MLNDKETTEIELASCRLELSRLRKRFREEIETRQQLEQEHRSKCDQLKESRHNLITIFDCFPEPLFLLDSDARVLMLNNAATRYCQIDHGEAIGRRFAELCESEGGDWPGDSLRNLVREGKEYTFERRTSNFPVREEIITLLPLAAEGHGIKGVIFRIQDVTEKEKINEQMMLADRLASMGRLASGLSHEIRNPLAGIMLFADILADPKRFSRSSRELKILDEIKENVRKITDLITQVFDFSRLNPSHKVASDLNGLLENLPSLWSSKMDRSGVQLKLSLEENLPLVAVDSVEMQQVFSNLIVNAVEAMPAGGVLTITTAMILSSFHGQRKVIVITFEDTGKGMPDEIRKKVFHPFFSTKSGRTGLGLTMSYQIVKRHGGILFCRKSDDNGTIFAVELPVD